MRAHEAAVLASLFGRGGDDGDDDEDERRGQKVIPEAQITMLRELFDRYRTCPFKPGDLAAMRKGIGGTNADAGQPCLVLEVRPNADPDFNYGLKAMDSASHLYGNRRDVRIATYTAGEYVAFWVESWILGPYEGPR